MKKSTKLKVVAQLNKNAQSLKLKKQSLKQEMSSAHSILRIKKRYASNLDRMIQSITSDQKKLFGPTKVLNEQLKEQAQGTLLLCRHEIISKRKHLKNLTEELSKTHTEIVSTFDLIKEITND